MSRLTLTDLGRELVSFFDDFLPGQRGLSPHTIRSYRDTLVLLLQFTAKDARRGVEQLTIRDLTEERVARFLRFLETDRKNGIATRNARLGSIHVFARFLAAVIRISWERCSASLVCRSSMGLAMRRSSTWNAPRWRHCLKASIAEPLWGGAITRYSR